MRTLKEQAPQLDYGVAYLPSPPDQPGLGCFTYGDVPVVPAGAKHAAGAWQLVQFLTGFGDDRRRGQVPLPAPDAHLGEGLQGRAVQAGGGEVPGFDVWARALFEAKRFLYPPKLPTAAGYGTTLGKYVTEARNGKMTPKEALDRATQEAQVELSRSPGSRPDGTAVGPAPGAASGWDAPPTSCAPRTAVELIRFIETATGPAASPSRLRRGA